MITQIKTFQAFQSSRVTTILKLARINIKVLLLSDSLFMNHPKKKMNSMKEQHEMLKFLFSLTGIKIQCKQIET